jgi:hypothetical protein
MPKRKRPEEKPEEQFKRFVETAKKLGVDDTGKELDAKFAGLSRSKKTAQKAKA